jgi:peptide/nickel transport system permease protein
MRFAKHLINALGTALGVTLFTFLVLRVVPGDPIELMLGESATAASRDLLRSQLGLSESFGTQLIHFLSRLAHGSLGTSIARHEPVTELILTHLPYTALLAFSAVASGAVIGIPLGVLSAYFSKRRELQKFDRALFPLSLFLLAIPTFWIGPLLVMSFSLHWPWLPVSTFRTWQGLILPTATLGLGMSAYLLQTTRAAVLECLSAEYIRTAYAKGAHSWQVLFRHALPNAFGPVFTVILLQLGHLLAGAVITETIFDWPGVGNLLVTAVMQRDYPVVQGVVLVVSVIYALVNSLNEVEFI